MLVSYSKMQPKPALVHRGHLYVSLWHIVPEDRLTSYFLVAKIVENSQQSVPLSGTSYVMASNGPNSRTCQSAKRECSVGGYMVFTHVRGCNETRTNTLTFLLLRGGRSTLTCTSRVDVYVGVLCRYLLCSRHFILRIKIRTTLSRLQNRISAGTAVRRTANLWLIAASH